MDLYYKKYITYKNKYINLKNQLGGLLCPLNTLNMGLDVDKIEDCNNVNAIGKVNIDDMTEQDRNAANEKGYKTEELYFNCYIKEENTGEKEIYKCTGPEKINRDFKIATYNIMGLDISDARIELIKKRMPLIASEIIDNDIDIVCFQEMSYTTYMELSKLLPEYDIYDYMNEGEHDFLKTHDRGHDVECAVAIKRELNPERIIVEPIGGNSKFTNSLLILEFPNLVIFNCYLQPGTKFSPGLSKIYLHYARCRQQLLQYIIDKLPNYNSKPRIILGDFNIDLNSSSEDFPDIQYINKLKDLGFLDNWEEIIKRVGGKVGLGLTEDTDTNIMRWNDKFLEKKTRVDGIFTIGLEIINSKIIGIKSLLIENDSAYKNKFIEKFTAAKKNYNHPNLKLIEGKIPIFASDHYGVMSTLRIM